MRVQTLGTLIGFGIQICAGAAALIWPNDLLIAYIIFAFGMSVMMGSILWWVATNRKTAVYPFTKLRDGYRVLKQLRIVRIDRLPDKMGEATITQSPAAPFTAREVDGPITWEFGSPNSPLGTSRSAGAPLWVDAFQIKGQNTSDDPIHARRASIRSDTTGRTLQLLFSHGGELLEPNVITIAPKGKFILIGRIPPTDPTKTLGVVVDQFREEFGAFTFTFEHGDPNFHYGDNTTYTRRFPWGEVDRILTNAELQSRGSKDRDLIIRRPPPYLRAEATAKAKPEPDVWYLDAIFYCVHGRWLGEFEEALQKPGQLDEAARFLNEFRQSARDGKIVVWGKIWENSTWDPIPGDYWAHHWVEPVELMRERPEDLVSDAATPEGKSGPFYKYLKVSRSQIEKHWPPQEEARANRKKLAEHETK